MTTSPDDLLGLEVDRTDADPGEAGGEAVTDHPERTVVAELRRQLQVERERSLNATDRVLAAQAEAAQARAEIKELQYRLHVRETELGQARELLAGAAERAARPTAGASVRQLAARAGTRLRHAAVRTGRR